jgi:hypothetical protein
VKLLDNRPMHFPEYVHLHLGTIERGLVGVLATSAGTFVSLLPTVESWLRVASLVVGITVGLATLYSILFNRKK